MIYGFAKQSGGIPTKSEIKHVVKRNFGGLEELDTWEIFMEELLPIISKEVPSFDCIVVELYITISVLTALDHFLFSCLKLYADLLCLIFLSYSNIWTCNNWSAKSHDSN